LIILGGMYHDFEGFTGAMKPVLEEAGYQVNETYDLDSLTRLNDMGVDIVLSYTCLTPHQEGEVRDEPQKLTDAQIEGLRSWVQAGGALLGAHSATVVGRSGPGLGELLGGVFLEHPPQFAFTVYPMHAEHPITEGIEPFTVFDEFYVQRLEGPVDVHMVALDRGKAFPMVWSKTEGQGRVAQVSMGHSEKVWDLPPYRQLMLQALRWAVSE
jgi:type 1 glutamine amidotransferase